jgi:hypothetical protein
VFVKVAPDCDPIRLAQYIQTGQIGHQRQAFGGTAYGVLTEQPGVLSSDFFTNLLDMTAARARPPVDLSGRGAVGAAPGSDNSHGPR